MASGCIVFVQGTGVRLKTYQQTLVGARERATRAGVTLPLEECEWGNAFGIRVPTLSLPGEPNEAQKHRSLEHEAQWAYLEDDPLFELRLLAAGGPPAAQSMRFGHVSKADRLWQTITARKPSLELDALLGTFQATALWDDVWTRIVGDDGASRTVTALGDDTADAATAIARALAAALSSALQCHGLPALDAGDKDRLIDRLRVNWDQKVFALTGKLKAFAMGLLRERRRDWSERVSPELGDILLYQANGVVIRDFIRKKIESLPAPVYLLAHSLGGIACFDLLAEPKPPKVAGLVTVGSQAPLLYEMGALHSLKRNAALPTTFPKWINLFDQNDFLSYVARPLFGDKVEDVEIESGELPLAAHSAYWKNDKAWARIKDFVA